MKKNIQELLLIKNNLTLLEDINIFIKEHKETKKTFNNSYYKWKEYCIFFVKKLQDFCLEHSKYHNINQQTILDWCSLDKRFSKEIISFYQHNFFQRNQTLFSSIVYKKRDIPLNSESLIHSWKTVQNDSDFFDFINTYKHFFPQNLENYFNKKIIELNFNKNFNSLDNDFILQIFQNQLPEEKISFIDVKHYLKDWRKNLEYDDFLITLLNFSNILIHKYNLNYNDKIILECIVPSFYQNFIKLFNGTKQSMEISKKIFFFMNDKLEQSFIDFLLLETLKRTNLPQNMCYMLQLLTNNEDIIKQTIQYKINIFVYGTSSLNNNYEDLPLSLLNYIALYNEEQFFQRKKGYDFRPQELKDKTKQILENFNLKF